MNLHCGRKDRRKEQPQLTFQFIAFNSSLLRIISCTFAQQILYLMGASQSLKEKAMHHGVQEFCDESWQLSESILKRTSSTAKLHVVTEDCKPIATYSSAKHSFLVDEYLLDQDEKIDVDEYFREIEWRNQCQYLVNVKYVKGFGASFICETGTPKNYLYIEHIPLRLSQITDIPFPDNLYLLKACLSGFYYIFLQTHILEIKEDQICLNQVGKVKVWMNTNLGKSTPSIYNAFKTGKKSELMLVREIINMIDENTDHQFEPKNFKDYLREQKMQNLTFREAIQAVQQFASILHIAIPSILESANDLFEPLHKSNRAINSIQDYQTYNTQSVGRGAETNQTRMLESVPLPQEEHSTVIYGSNRSPQFIKYLNNYSCPRSVDVRPCLPFQTIQYPTKVNFITQDVDIRTENIVNIQQPSKKVYTKINPDPQPHESQVNQDEWKYYDVNGWLEIDPEILRDLKNINFIS